MKRLLSVIALCAFVVGIAQPVGATLVSLPYNWVNGDIIDANQIMAQFNAPVNVINGGIDHTNVNQSVGFYSSDIKPVNFTQSTAGGSVAWIFPNGVRVTNVSASSLLCTDINMQLTTSCGSASGYVTSITGTANQVIASAATGAVTLSLPQNIGTGNSPTFVGMTLTGLSASLPVCTTAGMALSSTCTFPANQFAAASFTSGRCLRASSATAIGSAATDCPVLNADNNWSASQTIAGGDLTLERSGTLTNGAIFWGNTGGVAEVWNNATGVLSLNTGYIHATGGRLKGTSDGSSVSYYGPAYTSSGASTGLSTWHTSVIPTITTSGSLNTGCPAHGAFTNSYCGSVTLTGAAVFASMGSSSGATGNTMPSFKCGGLPWSYSNSGVVAAHLFSVNVSNNAQWIVIDDSQANIIYLVSSSGAGATQVGPITCDGT